MGRIESGSPAVMDWQELAGATPLPQAGQALAQEVTGGTDGGVKVEQFKDTGASHRPPEPSPWFADKLPSHVYRDAEHDGPVEQLNNREVPTWPFYGTTPKKAFETFTQHASDCFKQAGMKMEPSLDKLEPGTTFTLTYGKPPIRQEVRVDSVDAQANAVKLTFEDGPYKGGNTMLRFESLGEANGVRFAQEYNRISASSDPEKWKPQVAFFNLSWEAVHMGTLREARGNTEPAHVEKK